MKHRAKIRKSDNSFVSVILRPCFSTGVLRIIPHTTVSKRTHIYNVRLLQQVYLQHGGNNWCQQNDSIATACIVEQLRVNKQQVTDAKMC